MKPPIHTLVVLLLLTCTARVFGFGGDANYDPTKTMLFPGVAKSTSLFSGLHNSGEFGMTARAKKLRDGTLKRIRDMELAVPGVEGIGRLSQVGEGSVVKVKSTRRTETMNVIPSADGQEAKIFFRNKKGRVISNKATVPINGQFWFETFGKLKSIERDLKGMGPINPTYLTSNGLPLRGAASGYVNLDDPLLFALKTAALVAVKTAVITMGALTFAVAVESLVLTGASATAILGLFGGIATIAGGIVSLLQTIDPNAFSSVTEDFVSTSQEIIGFLEGTLDQIINVVKEGGGFGWSDVIEKLDELIEIPVKALSEDFIFVAEYSWPPTQQDLDTGTTFLGATVGYLHASAAPYMSWTGDDTSTGGTEVATIDLDAAAEAQVLPTSFSIDCKAGWYTPAGGSGPATLNMYLLNRKTGKRFGDVSKSINPGAQSGAATTPVGSGAFTYEYATRILRFSVN